jgi:PAS domain S-box-containing protein
LRDPLSTLPARNQMTGEALLLAVTLDLSWFDKLAADVGQRAGADVLLLDGKGTLLSRFPREMGLVGSSVSSEATIQSILNGSQGQLGGMRLDGKRGLFGYVRLSGTNVRLVVSFEQDDSLAHVNRKTMEAISVFGLVFFFFGVLIWSVGNRIFVYPLRDLHELLQVTLDNMDQGLIVDDKHGTVPICNRRALQLLDLPPELMKSRPKIETVIAFQKSRGECGSRDDFAVHLRGEAQNTFERERPNGSLLEIRVAPLVGGGVVRTYTDVTARKNAERRLAESEARYRLLADNSTDIMVRMSIDGRVEYISPACLPVTGYEPAELVGASIRDYVHSEDLPRVQSHLRDLIGAGPGARKLPIDYRARHKDGRWLSLEMCPTIVFDGQGRAVGWTDVNRNVTDRKALQSELLIAKHKAEEASRAKGEFLAAMTHEIRTPLSSIIGFTDLVLRSDQIGTDQRRRMHLIQNAGSALLTVVNDILDLSKIEAGQIELREAAFALGSLVESSIEIVRQQADAKRLSFYIDLDPTLWAWPMGDEDRLRQVLLNLLNNAVKFTSEGSITVRLHNEGTSEAGDRIRWEVEDTGIGIPDDKLPRLFQRFSQADGSISREFGGTGLGLSIAKDLVQLMQGSIGVSSKAGIGSTFWFEVTLKRGEPNFRQTATADHGQLERGRTGHILVVDDVGANLEIASAMLRQTGYQVDTVGDGAAAVEAVRSGRYDLVLMDVQMPVMDGLAATRAIRELGADASKIVVVAMTASVYAEQIAAFHAAGMNDHIAKPFRCPALLAVVDKWIMTERNEVMPRDQTEEREPKASEDLAPSLPEAETIGQLKGLLGAERLDEMLGEFQEELSSRFAAQPDGADALKLLRREAHSMISQAGMLGFEELSRRCRELQDACDKGSDISAALEALGNAQAGVLAALCTMNLGASDSHRICSASAAPRFAAASQ